MKKYALGLDFGTLSVRALFLDLETGAEAAAAEFVYPHGVMTDSLPDGTPLPPDFALEHPRDFLEGLQAVIRTGMGQLQLRPEQIAGIGLDVTSATVLPLDGDGQPLCLKPEFAGRPHAWMKLWKHHGAGDVAERLLQVAKKRDEQWLPYYGGWISSEFLIPKAVELAVRDPETFEHTVYFMEAGDWLVWHLTGNPVRSISMAGCTGYYRPETGYPSREFFREAYPEAEAVADKLGGKMLRLGQTAGCLLPRVAQALGLRPGTPVGIGTLDSHCGVIGCGASRLGDMVMVLGTSGNTMLNAASCEAIPGIYNAAPDANIPGMYGYEGGQNCIGDMFDWFVTNCVPGGYYAHAKAQGKNIHTYLMEKTEALSVGESGLVALDWFNGVRTPLMDLSLTATVAGLTVHTKPEELYRALLEAAAYGTRRIIETYEKANLPVERLIAGGGIPKKNPLLMQIYADVTGKSIHISKTTQASALGSAILGAAAAGADITGCSDVPALIEKYVGVSDLTYRPIPENVKAYERLYGLYCKLSDRMETFNHELKEG